MDNNNNNSIRIMRHAEIFSMQANNIIITNDIRELCDLLKNAPVFTIEPVDEKTQNLVSIGYIQDITLFQGFTIHGDIVIHPEYTGELDGFFADYVVEGHVIHVNGQQQLTVTHIQQILIK